MLVWLKNDLGDELVDTTSVSSFLEKPRSHSPTPEGLKVWLLRTVNPNN